MNRPALNTQNTREGCRVTTWRTKRHGNDQVEHVVLETPLELVEELKHTVLER